eukprot:TRINITY_DN37776_c0_g1_i1.p1 TRINITY_DN37776_c0_g1~~TRINITY_DN37776_c0_g1_i1.p1  ORF type:complete len:315 (+),score=54.56 TRINITY_DN37776_c0_g1_i1:36-947(+)
MNRQWFTNPHTFGYITKVSSPGRFERSEKIFGKQREDYIKESSAGIETKRGLRHVMLHRTSHVKTMYTALEGCKGCAQVDLTLRWLKQNTFVPMLLDRNCIVLVMKCLEEGEDGVTEFVAKVLRHSFDSQGEGLRHDLPYVMWVAKKLGLLDIVKASEQFTATTGLLEWATKDELEMVLASSIGVSPLNIERVVKEASRRLSQPPEEQNEHFLSPTAWVLLASLSPDLPGPTREALYKASSLNTTSLPSTALLRLAYASTTTNSPMGPALLTAALRLVDYDSLTPYEASILEWMKAQQSEGGG